MNGSLRIGSLFGIPIYIHWTFLVVIPLFAWIIGTQIALTVGLITGSYNFVFGWLHPFEIDTSLFAIGLYSYILGALIALGLFGGVLIHEMSSFRSCPALWLENQQYYPPDIWRGLIN